MLDVLVAEIVLQRPRNAALRRRIVMLVQEFAGDQSLFPWVGRAPCDSTAAGAPSGVMEGRRRGGIAVVASGFHRNHYGTFRRLLRQRRGTRPMTVP